MAPTSASSSDYVRSSRLTLPDVTAIARALNFSLPIKLDDTNYIHRKVQIRAAIKGLGLNFLITEPVASSTLD
ncbi:hypothetical protein Scep_019307 [Stephania cephalantha]|uniref:Uncharacterized protein n=1 Tax=Stephania cephalantha TaxID=152367 RepID=A0AAP0NM11_9MAGN